MTTHSSHEQLGPSQHAAPGDWAITTSRLHGDVLFGAVLAFVTLAPLIRELNGLLYLVIVVICVAAVISRRAWLVDAPLLIFVAIGVLYVAGSYAELFPRAWTRLYEKDAIPQQASFVATLYFIIAAGRLFWLDLLRSAQVSWRLSLLIVAGFLGPALLGLILGSFDFATAFGQIFRSLSNPAMMAYLSLGLLVFVCFPRRQIFFALLLMPFMAVLTPFLQNTLVALALVGLAFAPRPVGSLHIALLAFLSAWVVSFAFVDEIYSVANTLGLRLQLQLDALEAIRQTRGIGVGFGTEAITPLSFLGFQYFSGIDPVEAVDGWIYIGTHNSFIGMLFRLGVFGGIAFIAFFFLRLLPKRGLDSRIDRAACFTFFVLFIALFSNPTIESPTYHVGAGFAVGLLLALREISANVTKIRERAK